MRLFKSLYDFFNASSGSRLDIANFRGRLALDVLHMTAGPPLNSIQSVYISPPRVRANWLYYACINRTIVYLYTRYKHEEKNAKLRNFEIDIARHLETSPD
ncbi:hypothetical protein TSAR_015183 [Trichomalopsis sarcophagae]|uniref:Uncharacterized protein n=1 Tax=Trichomalopsis sarcophagae TaxID=543379 RepID=A0A232F7Q2_9HYME|nr:hypothetical protein TSAR_015183 [Trichomalopsis sarcophagae]